MPQSKKPRKKRKPPQTRASHLRAVPSEPPPEPPGLPFDPRTMEKLMASFARERFGDDLVETLPAQVLEAQEIIWDAMDEPDPRARVKLAREALKVSADCADAYVILAEDSATSLEKALTFYEQGVEAGHRALGDEFEETVGHFWGVLETRGFMRALAGRSNSCWELGRVEEALADAQELLRLNPSDNQGVRYFLVDWLLTVWRNDDAAALLKTPMYKDDASASWAWSRALLAIRRKDRNVAKAIRSASAVNPFVSLYLLGLEKPPKEESPTIGFGDPTEAADYFFRSFPAWAATPGAVHQVDKVLAGESLRRKRPP